MVLVLVLGFLSCIGIGIGIVKSTFQVLVLVLVLLKEAFPSIGIGIVKRLFQVLILLSSSAKVLVLGRNFGIGQL